MSENKCEFCNKIYKTKYILKTHIENNICRKNKTEQIIYVCECTQTFDRKYNYDRHIDTCITFTKIKVYMTNYNTIIDENKKLNQTIMDYSDNIKQIKAEYEHKLNEMINEYDISCKQIKIDNEKMLCKMKTEHDAHIQQLKTLHETTLALKDSQFETLHNMLHKMFSESINKPTTTTVHQNTQNISYRDYLSKDHTVDKLNENHLVERLRISMTEKMFFGGLRDIARLCYDCIVKLKDGKMILCCTDISRGKFKMYDLYGNIKEDIEARYFTEKVGKSLKVAGKEIYDCIMQSIQDEQLTLTEFDSKRKEELLDKFKRTCDAYIEIINVDDPGRNNEFINELAALTSVHAITTPLEPNTNPKRNSFLL